MKFPYSEITFLIGIYGDHKNVYACLCLFTCLSFIDRAHTYLVFLQIWFQVKTIMNLWIKTLNFHWSTKLTWHWDIFEFQNPLHANKAYFIVLPEIKSTQKRAPTKWVNDPYFSKHLMCSLSIEYFFERIWVQANPTLTRITEWTV